jgi:hypothetical protein
MKNSQILCKWATNGEQGEAKFDTVDDMFAHRMYNSFNFINMDKCGATKMPPYLPGDLQILSFNENKIFNLPLLPEKIRSISGINNRLTTFPETTHCFDLEDINLSGNEIVELDTYIALNVKNVNLDFNRLLFINYDKLVVGTKLSVSYNFLKSVPPASHIADMKFDHNDIPDREYHRAVMGLPQTQARTVPIPTAPPADNGIMVVPVPIRTVEDGDRFMNEINALPPELRYLPPAADNWRRNWEQPLHPERPRRANNGYTPIAGTDSQNVHNSSIQNSTNKSLDYVLNYKPKNSLPEDIITAVINAYKANKVKRSRMRRAMKFFSNSWAESSIFYPPIRQWCLSNDIHSSFGVTYKSLLKQVWAIIQDHPHSEELIDVLCQELDASEGVCFTGRFTRTLNALTGFIEEVQIGISSGEQMQNQITMAIKRWKDKLGDDFQVKAREEVRGILNEFKISEVEQEAWLDAIE